MSRLKQLFKNHSNASIILFLEPTTARFRLMPGDEMTLFYDHDAATDGIGAPLRIEYMLDGDEPMIVIYTFEDTMFLPDGTEAERDYS